MKMICRTTAFLAVALFGIAAAKAELGKPMAVVSIASYQEQMANIDFLGQIGGQQNASKALDGMLMMMTQGQGLKGLDKSKPWGFAVLAEGEAHRMLVFVPVSSVKDLTDTLALFVGPAQDEGNGILKISPPRSGKEFYVREQGGWAFVTDEKYEGPLPEDPLKLLDGLNKDYDVAARAMLQNVPNSIKEGAIAQMYRVAASQNTGDDAGDAMRREITGMRLKSIEQFVKDGDQLTVGWKLDKAAKNTHLDFSVTAVPGTPLADSLKAMNDSKTNFSGFLNPEFAVDLLMAHGTSQGEIENALVATAAYRKRAELAVDNDENLATEEDRKQVKTVLNQIFDVVDATIKTGKTDFGAAVNLGPEKLQAAAAVQVADSAKLESAVKNLIELAKGEPDFNEKVTVKLDAETYKGIRFHQALVTVPDDKAQQVLGDKLDVYLGIGEKAAYLAVGKDSLAFLKSIIDSSAAAAGKQVLPVQVTVSLAPIFDFAASVEPNGPAAMMASVADKFKGKDHVFVTAKPISNGVTGRLEVEDGVLQMVGAIAKARGGAGAPPRAQFQPQ